MPTKQAPIEASPERPAQFLREAFSLDGSATLYVLEEVAVAGLVAVIVCALTLLAEKLTGHRFQAGVTPYEVGGSVLSVLLVLRTNAGYDRWWEARRLWGGMVNASRGLASNGLVYGGNDPEWRDRFWRWVAAFSHATRRSLRSERTLPEIEALLGPEETARIAAADHMPAYIGLRIARMLQEAGESEGHPWALQVAEVQRCLLLDHMGGCERIQKTPLPAAYSIKIRQFIAVFLLTLPFGLMHKLGSPWLAPLITMLIAYPMLSLDRIGVELQKPFSPHSLNHLPLDDICATIERNVAALATIERPEK